MNRQRHKPVMTWMVLAAMMGSLTLIGCTESNDAPPGHDEHEHDEQAHATEHSAAQPHDEQGHEHEGEHEDEQVVALTPDQIAELGVEVRAAGPGKIATTLALPGEVVLNPNRVAHVVPRVPGVVREVRVSVGDRVETGQVMAVLVSRELARSKSEYLAALTRLDLARANFERVKQLWQQKIAPESEYLAAQQALREARLDVQLAERELHALGLSEPETANLPEQPEQALSLYELTAPISGEVIERHLTEGEMLHADAAAPPFVVADLGNVWVRLTVYPKDLAAIQPGQQVVVTVGEGRLKATGTIAYVSPVVDPATRTATARVVLENPQGRWKPGLFVTGLVRTATRSGDVVVPRSALQTIDGQTVVFVQTPAGFEPRPIEIGRTNGQRVLIVSGLKPDDRYVAVNPFILKAEMTKGSFGGNHH